MRPLAAAFFLLVLGACSAPAKPPVAGAPAPPPAAAPAAPAAGPVFDESLLHGREFLLELRAAPVVVKDIAVGALEPDPELVLVVTRFFQQASRGTVDGQLEEARSAAYLGSWVQRLRAAGLDPQVVRVGKALMVGDEWALPVRILGKKEFRGWVALARQDGSWVVSDVRLDESEPPPKPFDPESPGQEISRPMRR